MVASGNGYVKSSVSFCSDFGIPLKFEIFLLNFESHKIFQSNSGFCSAKALLDVVNIGEYGYWIKIKLTLKRFESGCSWDHYTIEIHQWETALFMELLASGVVVVGKPGCFLRCSRWVCLHRAATTPLHRLCWTSLAGTMCAPRCSRLTAGDPNCKLVSGFNSCKFQRILNCDTVSVSYKLNSCCRQFIQ